MPQTPHTKRARAERLAWVLLGVVVCILFSVSGILYDLHLQGEANARGRAILIAEASRSGALVESAAHDRLRHGAALTRSPFLAEGVARLVNHPDDPAIRASIMQWLASERVAWSEGSVSLHLPDGTLLAEQTVGECRPGAAEAQIVRQAWDGEPLLMRVIDERCGRPHLDLYVPIHSKGDPAREVQAVVVQRASVSGILEQDDSAGGYGLEFSVLLAWRAPKGFTTSDLSDARSTAMLADSGSSAILAESLDGRAPKQVVTEIGVGDESVLAAVRPVQDSPLAVMVSARMSDLRDQSGSLWATASVALGAVLGLSLAVAPPLLRRKDIEARRLLDAALRDREILERHLELLSKNANDVVLLANSSLGIVYFNDRAVQRYGHAPRELLESSIEWLVAPELLADERERLAQLGEGGAVYESTHLQADGAAIPVECSVREIPIGGVSYYQYIVRDISTRKLQEASLRAYREQLQALATECLLVEERERSHIASVLHDGLGQDLAAISLNLEMLADAQEDLDTRASLMSIHRSIAKSLEQTRHLTYELSPPLLHQFGLESAIRWYADTYTARYGVACRVSSDDASKQLRKDMLTMLYTSVRELLINVAKHAEASSAEVRLTVIGNRLRLEIIDDGVGFDVELAATTAAQKSSFGLFSVRERINYLGGSFVVHSEQGAGTSVSIEVPLLTSNDNWGMDDSSSSG